MRIAVLSGWEHSAAVGSRVASSLNSRWIDALPLRESHLGAQLQATLSMMLTSAGESFTLHGFPHTLDEARWLDRFLAARAAELSAVVVVRAPRTLVADRSGMAVRDESVLADYYRDRVVVVDGDANDHQSTSAQILTGLREVALAVEGPLGY